jgi:hypothetical protein
MSDALGQPILAQLVPEQLILEQLILEQQRGISGFDAWARDARRAPCQGRLPYFDRSSLPVEERRAKAVLRELE